MSEVDHEERDAREARAAAIRADLAEEGARILDGLRDGFHYDLRSDSGIRYVDRSEARLREILVLLGEP